MYSRTISLRVEAGAGFVQEQNLRVVHHGAGDGKALHHAAGEAADHLVGAIGELEAFEERFGALGAFLRREAEIGAVKEQNLARCEREIKIRALRDYTDQSLDGDLRFPDVVFADERLATGGADARRENADGGGFAGAVGAEQAENFSRQNVEGDAVERDDFRLGLLALGLLRTRGETARGSRGGSGGVDLAKVNCTNAGQHRSVLQCAPERRPGRRKSSCNATDRCEYALDDSKVSGVMSISKSG